MEIIIVALLLLLFFRGTSCAKSMPTGLCIPPASVEISGGIMPGYSGPIGVNCYNYGAGQARPCGQPPMHAPQPVVIMPIHPAMNTTLPMPGGVDQLANAGVGAGIGVGTKLANTALTGGALTGASIATAGAAAGSAFIITEGIKNLLGALSKPFPPDVQNPKYNLNSPYGSDAWNQGQAQYIADYNAWEKSVGGPTLNQPGSLGTECQAKFNIALNTRKMNTPALYCRGRC